MGYTALYRKFRPDNFEDVKGQDHIVKTLKNQIQAERIGHAYLFCGTRGTGKTSIAKIFARAVNCEHPVNGSPCNECASCRSILSGASIDVVEMDAASNNGVDNIREIREEVTYPPVNGRYKVYIIDEVHMLSTGAFNALLKTLEEPPAYVIFILATTEAHKIPITILSRCQRYDFRRIGQGVILDRLKELMEAEQIPAEEKALRYIARKGDGSLRDSLSLLDQCIAFYIGEELTYEKVLDVLGAVDNEVFSDLLRKIIAEDVLNVIKTLEELITQGRDLTQFVNDFTWYLRNLMLIKASDDMEDVLDVSAENLQLLLEEGALVRNDTLMRFIRIFSELSNSIRYATNRRVLVEMALIKLCRPEMERDEISLLERIRRLESKMDRGYVPAGSYVQNTGAGYQQDPAGYGYTQEYHGYAVDGGMSDQITHETGEDLSTGGYRKIAPEDLQAVKTQWGAVVSATSGMFKTVLASAQPKYNTKDENDGKLYVVFADFLAERYSQKTEYKSELEQIIRKLTGKSVEVQFVLAEDEGIQKGKLGTIGIESQIRSLIHTDIEIED